MPWGPAWLPCAPSPAGIFHILRRVGSDAFHPSFCFILRTNGYKIRHSPAGHSAPFRPLSRSVMPLAMLPFPSGCPWLGKAPIDPGARKRPNVRRADDRNDASYCPNLPVGYAR